MNTIAILLLIIIVLLVVLPFLVYVMSSIQAQAWLTTQKRFFSQLRKQKNRKDQQ